MNEAFCYLLEHINIDLSNFLYYLCGKSCDLEKKHVVFATPVSQKRRRQPISFILDSLSAQMNVPDTKFSRNTMKLLNHNASTLRKVSAYSERRLPYICRKLTKVIVYAIGLHACMKNNNYKNEGFRKFCIW